MTLSARWIHDPPRDGLTNMAADAAAVESLLSGLGSPVFRTYSWQPWTVSLGYHQRTEELFPTMISDHGFGMVRRPTGGRAVFHANEITYSCILPLGDNTASGWYRLIHKAFRQALLKQNILTELRETGDSLKTIYRDMSSVPCFISSAQTELELDGRKLVGSAQRQYGPVLLQHGSILLGPEHEQITDFLNFKSEEEKQNARRILSEKSVNLTELHPDFSIQQFISDLPGLLSDVCGFNLIPGNWMPEEQEMITHLSKKFRVYHEH